MKKLAYLLTGIVAVGILILTAMWGRAFSHNRTIEKNIGRVQVGMTQKEVIEILGEPIKRHMSDDGEIWCFTIYPFDNYDENCGLGVSMSPNRVTIVHGQ